MRVTEVDALDIRFPTSLTLDGSDAMNPDPDYSAGYVRLHTNTGDVGYGLTFTIGRGTEVVVAAIEALRSRVVGCDVAEAAGDMGAFWRHMTGDSQLRWIGPEKGAIHLATAAIVNAVWDLWAKSERKPLWKLLADLSPRELVQTVDFTYITDVIDADEAVDLLTALAPTREQRIADLEAAGYPAYVTSVGWLGYEDEKVARLCREAMDAGWTHVKMKVGASVEADVHRAELIRGIIGPDVKLMMDANQRWDVGQAIDATRRLAHTDPWWMEEPTSPDDILGHATIARAVAPIRIATGEHAHNRVMFKQLLQAKAIGFCQIDACRLGGVNEVIAVLLMAAKLGVPVCPHAGGVGLCEYVQHLSAFDYVAVSGSLDDRVTEFADHLHSHFVAPARIRKGRYVLPTEPGYSIEMHQASIDEFTFPGGSYWASRG